MGIMPDPGTFNNECPLCFPAGQTPTSIKLFASGITYNEDNFPGLPPAPNGYVDLEQSPGPCQWSGANFLVWRATLTYTGVDSRVSIEVDDGIFAFNHSPGDLCVKYFENQQQNPAIFAYTGGWVMITTPAAMETMIALVTPLTGPDPRMELFPMEDGLIVLKFCSIQDGTNIKIKLDTALL